MDLVELSQNTKNIQIYSNAVDNITKFIMTMSNHQDLKLHHMLTLDVLRMVENELPQKTTIDKKALCIDILNRVYSLNDDEKNLINRDIDLILGVETLIIRVPIIKRTVLNCFNYFKKKLF